MTKAIIIGLAVAFLAVYAAVQIMAAKLKLPKRSRPRVDVHIHNHVKPPREKRVTAFQKIQRKQAENRRARFESRDYRR